MHFRADQVKPLILNNANWLTMEDAYGDDSDMWRGKPVEVYVDAGVMFAGKRVGGIRLRAPSGPSGGANGSASNGRAPAAGTPAAWTLAQATEECRKAGISRDDLVNRLKAEGRAGWNGERDTPTARAMIDAAIAGAGDEGFDDELVAVGAGADRDIPF
jgi:hypothetical protein